MELELISHVSNCKVALSDLVPASLKGHLVAGKPALVAHHCCAMNGRTIDIIVDIAAEVYVVTLVARLDLSTFFAGRMLGGKKTEKT